MATERCPSCAAVVRAGDPWCTLCWTDLRPKPEPAPDPVPEPVPAAVPLAVVAPAPIPRPPVDPLTAPLSTVLGHEPVPAPAVPALAPDEPAWPCVDCGAANPMDLDQCARCGTPFGGRISRVEDPKGTRRKVYLVAALAVGMFLMLLAALTLASTGTPAS